MTDVNFFDPAREAEAKRKRLMAQTLMAQSQKFGDNEMVSGHVLPKTFVERLGNIANQYTASVNDREADKLDSGTSAARQALYQKALASTDPREAAALLAQDPESLGAAAKLYGDALNNDQSMAAEQRKYQMERELYGMKNARDDAQWDKDANLKRELARMRQGGGGQEVGQDADGNPIYSQYSDKPLPVGALKLQQDATDALAAAKSISETSGLLSQQLGSGDLKVGPLENIISGARNWAGKSSPNSQAYANMETALEKIRNDSLRLNKGVQTEGDAERAMKEVIASKNDPDLLKNAMDKLKAINDRGAELQRLQVNNIRGNYNAAPMNFDGINALPSAIPPQGAGQADKVRSYLQSKGMTPEQVDAYLKAKGL